MKNRFSLNIVSNVLIFLLTSSIIPVYAEENPYKKAEEILKKINAQEEGEDQISTVSFLFKDKDGKERKSKTQRFWKNYRGVEGLKAKAIIYTEYPPDEKGTTILVNEYTKEKNKDDELWIYIPSLRKVRQITKRDKNEAFMGSDLNFTDLEPIDLVNDEHKFVREEKLGEYNTYVIETIPKGKDAIYSRKIWWIWKEESLPLKIEYYDLKTELLKTQFTKWEKNENIWVWNKLKVKNHQNLHETIISIEEMKVNNGLTDDFFTVKNIETQKFLKN